MPTIDIPSPDGRVVTVETEFMELVQAVFSCGIDLFDLFASDLSPGVFSLVFVDEDEVAEFCGNVLSNVDLPRESEDDSPFISCHTVFKLVGGDLTCTYFVDFARSLLDPITATFVRLAAGEEEEEAPASTKWDETFVSAVPGAHTASVGDRVVLGFHSESHWVENMTVEVTVVEERLSGIVVDDSRRMNVKKGAVVRFGRHEILSLIEVEEEDDPAELPN